jgi:hypothetical protein
MPSWIPDKTLPVDVWNWRESDDSAVRLRAAATSWSTSSAS